jgi:hypothetical protein
MAASANHVAATTEDLSQRSRTKFNALQDDIQGTTDRNKTSIATYAAIAGGVVVILAFAFGRRSGRKRRSVLEIRR